MESFDPHPTPDPHADPSHGPAEAAPPRLAHDARNALAVVIARAQFAARRLAAGRAAESALLRDLAEIERAARRATRSLDRWERGAETVGDDPRRDPRAAQPPSMEERDV